MALHKHTPKQRAQIRAARADGGANAGKAPDNYAGHRPTAGEKPPDNLAGHRPINRPPEAWTDGDPW